MRRILVVACMLLAAVIGAVPAAAFDVRTTPNVSLGPGETVNDDFVATGSTVLIAGHVTGDLYAFGQTVTLANTARVDGDVIVAGQTVILGGTIGGSLRTAGQTVQVISGTTVAGGMAAAGQDVAMQGAVGRGMASASQALQVGGTVGKELRATATTLTILPTAKIGGDVIYDSPQPAAIPGGVVAGQVQYVTPANNARRAAQQNRQQGAGFGWFLRIAWLIGSAIVGIALIRLFPRLRDSAQASMIERPVTTFAAGVIALIAAPVLAIVLLITVIGIPISLVGMAGYLIFVWLGWLLAAYVLGALLIRVVNRGRERALAPEWPFLLGLAVLFLLRLLPYVGWAVALVGTSFGFGALLVALFGAIQTRRQVTEGTSAPGTATLDTTTLQAR